MNKQKLIFWIVWVSLLNAVFMYYYFFTQPSKEWSGDNDVAIISSLISLFAALFVRYVGIQRKIRLKSFNPNEVADLLSILPLAVITWALMEAISFYALFFSGTEFAQDVLWTLSVIGLLITNPYPFLKERTKLAFVNQ